MSLRDLEHAPRHSSIRKLSKIAEQMSDGAGGDVAWCQYCHKPFRMSQYERHKCRGKRLKNLYGESEALNILAAEATNRRGFAARARGVEQEAKKMSENYEQSVGIPTHENLQPKQMIGRRKRSVAVQGESPFKE